MPYATSRRRRAGFVARMAAMGLTALVLGAPPARAQFVASLERLGGEVTISSESNDRAGAVGTRLRQGDLVMTGQESIAVVVFQDGSRVHLGESTRVAIAGFAPEQGRTPGALMIALEAGAMRLRAEAAARAPHKRIEVRSGSTTISASHEADLWCGLADDGLSVLVLAGKVRVANWSGSVLIERRRAGTVIPDLLTPPEPAYGWDRERIRRALASVGAE